jgi:hypothetical protein
MDWIEVAAATAAVTTTDHHQIFLIGLFNCFAGRRNYDERTGCDEPFQ